MNIFFLERSEKKSKPGKAIPLHLNPLTSLYDSYQFRLHDNRFVTLNNLTLNFEKLFQERLADSVAGPFRYENLIIT